MKIIIAGVGDLGFHLARFLAYEDQDITLIDKDESRLEYATSYLDVLTVRGSSTSISVLEQAQVGKSDLLIAVTSVEEANLTTAILGKKLGAGKTIARVSNSEFLSRQDKVDLRELGIDEVVSPEQLATKEIGRLIKQNALTDTFEFEKGKLSLVGLTVDEDCELRDKTLDETSYLNPDKDFTTVAILRGDQTIIPRGNDTFLLNDHAYFIAEPSGVGKVMSLTGKHRIDINNLMIFGSSRLGISTAKLLCKKYDIKLIEKDKEKCFRLADELPDVMVINGDARDIELLRNENIQSMGAVIALTGNSETNIISCLSAKKMGVGKTIAAVENIDYIHLSQNIGIDTLINKKLIAASFIFKYIRRGKVINLTSVDGLDAEILEFEVSPGSKVADSFLKDLDFPKTSIIGGVIRKGIGHTVRGDFVFKPKDRVVVLSQKECIPKVESFFK